MYFFLNKSISDQCALLFKVVKVDQGPTLFKYLDMWRHDREFKGFVKLKWKNYEVWGTKMMLVKEKLKKAQI